MEKSDTNELLPKRQVGKVERELLRSEPHRLSTFRNWKFCTNKEDLAKSGFYYFNQGDACQCIYCLIILSDWTETDVPNQEHRKWSNRCPFVLGLPVGNSEITGTDEARTPDLSSFTIPIPKGLPRHIIRPNAIPEKSPPMRLAPECGRYDYNDIRVRLHTFKLWPKLSQTKEELAEAGFCYTGQNDQVKCPFCQITVNCWMPDEKPLDKHIYLSPDCTFIQKLSPNAHIQFRE